MIKLIENLTKMNKESQAYSLRLFSRVDIYEKIKIIKYQKQIFHKLKDNHINEDNAILTLSSLILSIDIATKKLDIVNLNAIKIRNKNNKAKIKRQKLLTYWAIIKTLKSDQNMSFRQISKYFAQYHRFNVSHSTIYQLWNEIEKNTGEK